MFFTRHDGALRKGWMRRIKSPRASVFLEFAVVMPIVAMMLAAMTEFVALWDARVMANHAAFTVGRIATVEVGKSDRDKTKLVSENMEKATAILMSTCSMGSLGGSGMESATWYEDYTKNAVGGLHDALAAVFNATDGTGISAPSCVDILWDVIGGNGIEIALTTTVTILEDLVFMIDLVAVMSYSNYCKSNMDTWLFNAPENFDYAKVLGGNRQRRQVYDALGRVRDYKAVQVTESSQAAGSGDFCFTEGNRIDFPASFRKDKGGSNAKIAGKDKDNTSIVENYTGWPLLGEQNFLDVSIKWPFERSYLYKMLPTGLSLEGKRLKSEYAVAAVGRALVYPQPDLANKNLLSQGAATYTWEPPPAPEENDIDDEVNDIMSAYIDFLKLLRFYYQYRIGEEQYGLANLYCLGDYCRFMWKYTGRYANGLLEYDFIYNWRDSERVAGKDVVNTCSADDGGFCHWMTGDQERCLDGVKRRGDEKYQYALSLPDWRDCVQHTQALREETFSNEYKTYWDKYKGRYFVNLNWTWEEAFLDYWDSTYGRLEGEDSHTSWGVASGKPIDDGYHDYRKAEGIATDWEMSLAHSHVPPQYSWSENPAERAAIRFITDMRRWTIAEWDWLSFRDMDWFHWHATHQESVRHYRVLPRRDDIAKWCFAHPEREFADPVNQSYYKDVRPEWWRDYQRRENASDRAGWDVVDATGNLQLLRTFVDTGAGCSTGCVEVVYGCNDLNYDPLETDASAIGHVYLANTNNTVHDSLGWCRSNVTHPSGEQYQLDAIRELYDAYKTNAVIKVVSVNDVIEHYQKLSADVTEPLCYSASHLIRSVDPKGADGWIARENAVFANLTERLPALRAADRVISKAIIAKLDVAIKNAEAELKNRQDAVSSVEEEETDLTDSQINSFAGLTEMPDDVASDPDKQAAWMRQETMSVMSNMFSMVVELDDAAKSLREKLGIAGNNDGRTYGQPLKFSSFDTSLVAKFRQIAERRRQKMVEWSAQAALYDYVVNRIAYYKGESEKGSGYTVKYKEYKTALAETGLTMPEGSKFIQDETQDFEKLAVDCSAAFEKMRTIHQRIDDALGEVKENASTGEDNYTINEVTPPSDPSYPGPSTEASMSDDDWLGNGWKLESDGWQVDRDADIKGLDDQ